MKKALALAAFVLAYCVSAFGETWKDANGVTWEFESNYDGSSFVATIKGATPAPKGALVIPAAVSDGYASYKVSEIYGGAFYGNAGITAVVVPSSVTKIGNSAFGSCAKLASVTFKGDTPTLAASFFDVFWDTPLLANSEGRNGNDDMANPRTLYGASGETKDDNYTATIVPGEPITKVAPSSQHATKWYEWTAPKSGTVWFWTPGATFDTFLGVCTSDDTPADIAYNCDFSGGVSQVAFGAAAGTKYRIYVGGVGARYLGSYALKWRMGSPVKLTFDTCGGAMDMGIYGGDVVLVPKNAAVGVLPAASKEYYALAGWYTKKSGGTKVTAKTKFAKATKLYAHWAKKKLKVSVAKGAGAKSAKGSGSYAWGTKVKLSAIPKPGYAFRTWLAVDMDEASEKAFPKYNTQRRRNATPAVTVPKTSGLSYRAEFVKKTEDTVAINVTAGSTTLYAEDGAGGFVELEADSFSYPAVTTTKLPAGVKFSLLPPPTSPDAGVVYDSQYRLEIVDADKVPAGRNVIKVTAKNRSGKTATKSVAVWGMNRTQASAKGAVSVTAGTSAKTPNEIYVGVKYTLADLGVSVESGWKVSKIAGLPSGITWDAKSQKLKGYASKAGTYTFTFTAAKGKTTCTETLTYKAKALPAKLVGTFYGYAAPDEYGTFFNASSRKVTASVASVGKVSAKVGGLSFTCNGLTYNAAGGKFVASMKSSVAKSKTVTYVRSLSLEFDPAAAYCEDSLVGAYFEYNVKKTGSGITEDLLAQRNIVGRRNVFGYDDSSNLLFEGADLAQDALDQAAYSYQSSDVAFAGGSVTVAIDGRCNGLATLTGTIDGKAFVESAVIQYAVISETKGMLVIRSFNLGMEITYGVNVVQDYAGPYVDEVGPPTLPQG